MTVINISGTSGSGKTTIVRQLLNQCSRSPIVTDYKIQGYYVWKLGIMPTVIVGSYEKPTGGCDTISPITEVFKKVLYYHEKENCNVIFEGLLISRSKGRMIALWNDLGQQDLFIYHLTTSIEDCMEGIRQRRALKGNNKPVDPKRTLETYYRVAKITGDLKALGIPVEYTMREEALQKIIDRLSQNEP